MDQQLGFSLSVSQNKYLSTGDTEMHAIITITADDADGRPDGRQPPAAVVLAIDCSGSMDQPPTKIAAARQATQAAIDAIRDGVFFAVVEGTHQARPVYPTDDSMVAATAGTRAAAKAAVRRLVASGATAMGTWLRAANQLVAAHPAAVRHAILLTDGRNLPEYRRDLDEALAACAGRFVCDGRGIGDDYEPAELERITGTLHGSADAILTDSDLVADFTALMDAAMGKVVPDVQVQLRTMPFSRLRFLRQIFPVERDLTAFATVVDERTVGFSTGSWSCGEEREFHLCLEVDRADHAMNEDIQACRVDLAVIQAGSTRAERCGRPQPVIVHWTADMELSSVMDPKVAQSSGYGELAGAVQAGWDAHRAGDTGRAEAEWGRAVALAAGRNNSNMLTRLGRIVEIIGAPADGNVRVRPDLRPRDIFSAILGASATTRNPDVAPPDRAESAAAKRTCPDCGHISPAGAAYCMGCGIPLGEPA
jgi:Ca-activated chloride channel family protein